MAKKQQEKPFRVVSMTLCEDIRTEINNKHSLMGVFPGDIFVADFPAMGIELALYVEAEFFSAALQNFNVTYRYNGQTKATMGGAIGSSKAGIGGVACPQIILVLEKEGELEVEISTVSGVQAKIERRISKGGVVPSTLPLPAN